MTKKTKTMPDTVYNLDAGSIVLESPPSTGSITGVAAFEKVKPLLSGKPLFRPKRQQPKKK